MQGKVNRGVYASILIIIFFCLLSSINSVPNQFINYDDTNYIINNERIKGRNLYDAVKLFDPRPFFRGEVPRKLNEYLPLRDLSYLSDFWIWGLNPVGFHLTNALLYSIICLEVFFLLSGLSVPQGLALPITLLYSAHPLHSEAVAWVSARKDLVCAVFFLLSLINYVNFLKNANPPQRAKFYFLSIFAFILSWLSKPAAITLPLILLLLELLLMGMQNLVKTLTRILPFFLITIFFLLFSLSLPGVAPSAPGPRPGLLSAVNYIKIYAQNFFLPLGLNPGVTLPDFFKFISLNTAASIILILILLYLFIFSKNYIYVFSTGFFLINLLPVLNLTRFLNYNIQDRYMLLPSLGLCMISGIAINRIKPQSAMKFIFLTILTCLLLITIRQNSYWRNSRTLWQYTIKVSPDFGIAHLNLGGEYMSKNELNSAEKEFLSVLESRSATPEIRSMALKNLGSLYLKENHLEKAIQNFEAALDGYPDPSDLHRIIGGVYIKLKQPEKAIMHYRESLIINPRHPDRELIEFIIGELQKSTSPLPEPQP